MAKKTITVKMDKERHLRFGMNSFIELEKELGKPVTELGEDISMEDIRTMFYVGLKWESPKITPFEVGELMDEALEENDFQYLVEKITEAINGGLGATALPNK